MAGLAALAALACHRPLPARESRDAGGDGLPAEASDSGREEAIDAGDDSGLDGPAFCPAGVGPVDVCGCGCCGAPQEATCYYPALGQSAAGILNPIPPPQTCATAGCAGGVRHLCCIDPGPQLEGADLCADDRSIEDLRRFAISRRDGTVCTTVMFEGGPTAQLPIDGPQGYAASYGLRGPCDGSPPQARIIGAAGSVNLRIVSDGGGVRVADIHATLFFDGGTGIASSVRLDADSLVIQSTRCASGMP
jgi:hypothetical protein